MEEGQWHLLDLRGIKSQQTRTLVLQKLSELSSGQTSENSAVNMLKTALKREDLEDVLTANNIPFNFPDRKNTLAEKLVQEVVNRSEEAETYSDSEDNGNEVEENSEEELDVVPEEAENFEEEEDEFVENLLEAEEDVQEEEEDEHAEAPPLVHPLPTCHTQYIPMEEGAYEVCTCPTVANDLVLGLATKLPKVSIDLLRESCSMNVDQLMEQIVNFGGFAVESGCKNRMLLQLRDIFLEHNGQPGLMNLSEIPFHLDQSVLANVAEGLTAAEGGQAQPDPTTPVAGNLVNIEDENERQVHTPVMQQQQAMVAATPQQRNEMQLECCVCLDGKRTVIFVPCGHIACCRNCADQLVTCAVCRANIDMKLDIHYA